ncbi:glutamic acid-rich protein-like [Saccostrea cucullata]|uniref:glutamic acid-rich protein-like n=1 Tax=Saccostrea cuccullata TaxID=36930 RepID=UPI002ED2C5EB
MTSMNDAARTLKHTSQGSRAGTKQQTRGSARPPQHGESQSDDRRQIQSRTDNQSRQRSNQNQNFKQSRQRSQQPEQNLNQSRQRTQPEPNLNQSRQRSQPEPNLNQSRQRTQPEPNLNQSRQRSQPESDLNQSRQRTQPEPNLNQSRQRTQPEPNLNQSRQRSQQGYDEDYENNNRSRQRSQQTDPRSRERTQDGQRSVLQTQDRNRSVIQSPGGWSNREEIIPQSNLSQQAVTPRSQRPSQQGRISARPSQTGGSRGAAGPSQQAENEDEYDEEEEDEDDVSEDNSFVDYYPEYAPPPSTKPKGPRAETADDYETCSCFPRRKNKNIPSMLYENITCVHTGLKGQSHAGVFRFEDNWIEGDVQTAPKQKGNEKKNKKKERTIPRPKMKYVYGYPKPVLPAFSDDEEGDDQDEDDDDEDLLSEEDDIDAVSTKSKPQPNLKKSKSKSNNKKKQQKKDDNDTGVEEMDDDDFDEEEEDEPQGPITREEAYYPVMLPQIGHSPPPSRERSRLSARSQPALPPLPESPFMTTHKDKKKPSIKPSQSFRSEQRELPISRESGRHSAPDIRMSPSPRAQKPIMKTRRFQGVYFDPVRKRAVPYDISWNGHLEQNDGRMSSRMPSRMRSGSRYSKADIPEEEDYYDDEGYEEDMGTSGHR